MSEDVNPEDVLSNYLKANKDDHYNFEDTVEYKVSSGSLQLDLYLAEDLGLDYTALRELTKGAKLQSLYR